MAAGTNTGSLRFWDRRTRKQIAQLDDAHADLVTAAHFHPQSSSMFVSSSDDGLIAVFDFAQGINEDDAFVVRIVLDTTVVQCMLRCHGCMANVVSEQARHSLCSALLATPTCTSNAGRHEHPNCTSCIWLLWQPRGALVVPLLD